MRYTVKRQHDQRGAGGNIASGLRLVRKGGRFRFDSMWFYHPDLENLVGKTVYISDPEDIWYSHKIRVEDQDGVLVCYAVNETSDEHPRRVGYRPQW